MLWSFLAFASKNTFVEDIIEPSDTSDFWYYCKKKSPDLQRIPSTRGWDTEIPRGYIGM
jgi:hypothetical protein